MKKYILTLILALASLGLYAQTNRNKTIINAALHGWEYEIKAGVNLGGTAPLPLFSKRSPVMIPNSLNFLLDITVLVILSLANSICLGTLGISHSFTTQS